MYIPVYMPEYHNTHVEASGQSVEVGFLPYHVDSRDQTNILGTDYT